MDRGHQPRSRSPHGRTYDGYYAREDYRQRSPDQHDMRGPNRRMRSRSPGTTDRYTSSRPQQRSPSRDGPFRTDRNDHRPRRPPHGNNPGNIDRYVPGQDDSVPRDRLLPLFNPIPKPEQCAYLVPFVEFRDWWLKEQEINEERERRNTGTRRPADKPRGEAELREQRQEQRENLQAAYDEYREKFIAKSTKIFVHHHKNEEWFKERYDPNVSLAFRQRLAEHRLESYERWNNDLHSGIFDDFNLEGIYKSESNGAGGVLEKEEGEATGAADVQAVSDLVPAKGADLRDDAAMQPALLIKTMAAHVQRIKIEEFCKEHLGEGPGGYRWLSLSDPNGTKKFTRLGWVLLQPKEDEPITTNGQSRSDGRDEDVDEMRDSDQPMGNSESKDADKPKSYVDQALAQVDNKAIEDEEKGNFTCHFGIHDPQAQPRKKALWDLMSLPERIERDLDWATRLATKLEQELGVNVEGVVNVGNMVETMRSEGRLHPVTSTSVKRGTKKTPAVLGEEPESGEEEGEDGEAGEDDEQYEDEADDEELLVKKKKLDLLVEYLRRVFNFCFFCVVEADSVIDLERKCAGGHLRRPRGGLTSLARKCAMATVTGEGFPLKKQKAQEDEDNEDGAINADKNTRFDRKNNTHLQLQKAFSWVTRYEDMLRQIVEPESVDLKKLGARTVDEALDEDLKAFRIAEAEEDRFKCKITDDCKKMFKAEHFWRKHVEKRHSEWLQEMKMELDQIVAFALDPNHVQAYNVITGNMGRHNVMSGLPRNAGPNGFGANFGHPAFGPPMTFPPTQMQPPFAQVMGNMGIGGVGPARSGRSRQTNRANGPYDRIPNDARSNRWRAGGGGGRVSPRNVAPQVFPDAVAGGGSKESIAGRKVKTYDDIQLDY